MRISEVQIGDYKLCYNVEEDSLFGPEEVLLEQDENLICNTSWRQEGYTIEKFIDNENFSILLEGAKEIIFSKLKMFIAVERDQFLLSDYHRLIKTTERHHALIRVVREGFHLSQFPIDVSIINKRISQICGFELTSEPGSYFYLRIIRPNVQNDNNPPHRDVWIREYKDAINIYVPIAGSTIHSSLPLIPGSHSWRESEIERTVKGAKINGVEFQVPAVIGYKKPIQMIRPNPGYNEVMVFSPYIIHGGGINLNSDQTRVSLEMRFWRKPQHS